MKTDIKIISGGQTGVDRAALDVALELNIPCGGYCPEGRLAEDGAISDRYPMIEMEGGGYIERTEKNVIESEATVIIYYGALEGGTKMTLEFCKQHNKPFLTVNQKECSVERAIKDLGSFIAEYDIKTLNVAGPRASKQPQIYDYTYQVLTSYFTQ